MHKAHWLDSTGITQKSTNCSLMRTILKNIFFWRKFWIENIFRQFPDLVTSLKINDAKNKNMTYSNPLIEYINILKPQSWNLKLNVQDRVSFKVYFLIISENVPKGVSKNLVQPIVSFFIWLGLNTCKEYIYIGSDHLKIWNTIRHASD